LPFNNLAIQFGWIPAERRLLACRGLEPYLSAFNK
jgi:hypothetical protein